MAKRIRERCEIRSVTHKHGTTNVLFWEGRARPWQITVRPDGWEGGKGRMVSLKTEEAVKERLDRNMEWHNKRFAQVSENWK